MLELQINSNLTWNDHVEELVKKTCWKLYFLAQLKRALVSHEYLVAYFCACIRSSLDYAGFPPFSAKLLTDRPGTQYTETIDYAGIQTIRQHRGAITEKRLNLNPLLKSE